MNLHTVYLRNDCILPGSLDPLRAPIGRNWTRVEELLAAVFDTLIRQTGWHFMWIQESSARRGIGRIRQNAINRALDHALNGIAGRFNAAELDSVEVSRHFGLFVEKVTVQARQIQQQISLECPNDI